MVGPAAKRESVAHLQSVMGRRNGGPAVSSARTARWSTIARAGRPIRRCEGNCAILPTSAGALAIGGSSSFCGKRGEPSGINRIYRLYREEGLAVRNVVQDVGRSEHERRS